VSIAKILQGIDHDEISHTDGWWETSAGTEFGRVKLIEALAYEVGLLTRIAELETRLVETIIIQHLGTNKI
jgi:hypothetical protein